MRIGIPLFQAAASEETINSWSPASAAHFPVHDGLLRGRESCAGAGGFFDLAALAEAADEDGGWLSVCGGGGVAPY